MSQTSVADAQSSPPFAGVLIEKLLTATATSAEAAAEIPFGVVVQGGTADDTALLLAGAAALDFLGVVLHSHAHAKPTELGDTGLKPKATFTILRKGSLWVTSETAVTPDDPVHVRHTAGAGGTVLGAFRQAAVANETFDFSSFCRWRTSCAAAGVAKLEVDFTNCGLATADT